MSNSIHVLVVDDSAVVRQTILAILGTQADVRTSIAPDPIFAAEKMKRDRPDVIVLDLEMPRMHGLTFLRKLMIESPLPVIVCSSHVGGAGEQALLALEAGAVEVIAKPRLGVQDFLHDSAVMLIDTVRAAAASKVPSRRAPAANVSIDVILPPPALLPRPRSGRTRAIAIGASTGGTEAIREILDRLPESSPGIVIVQHMPAGFTRSFAKRLNESSALEVKEAETGDEIRPGRALVAPGDKHLVVLANGPQLYVDVIDGPLVMRHRPSVDVLFRSVANALGSDAIGVILTGMGADGASGLADLRRVGGRTFAQDEATSVVYGMPGEAVRRGAVENVLPLLSIAGALQAAF